MSATLIGAAGIRNRLIAALPPGLEGSRFALDWATTASVELAELWRAAMEQQPSIGRVVWYRSRTGKYTVPAMITATVETLAPEAVEAGRIPALSSPSHVHLTVFSPGAPGVGWNAMLARREGPPVGHGRGAGDPDVPPELPPGAASYNLAGTYQEWDVPFFNPEPEGREGKALPVSCAPTIQHYGELEQRAGSWTWPERR